MVHEHGNLITAKMVRIEINIFLVVYAAVKSSKMFCCDQCDQIGQFFALWATKPLATINLPKSPTFLANFCKGVKIYYFSTEIILGNFYRHLAFFLVTLVVISVDRTFRLRWCTYYYCQKSTFDLTSASIREIVSTAFFKFVNKTRVVFFSKVVGGSDSSSSNNTQNKFGPKGIFKNGEFEQNICGAF